MKVLFNHGTPFSFAHGGFQIQIEQTIAALKEIGVEGEYVRWWDPQQEGDILHHFGRPAPSLITFAKKKGLRVVFLDLLTGQGSRPLYKQRLHRLALRLLRTALPAPRASAFAGSYLMADACVANTLWESFLMTYVLGAPDQRVHVVPNGVEDVFLNSTPRPRGQWLVCTATIDARKRVFELAQAAIEAKTPLWVIGKPYTEAEPYFQKFVSLVNSHKNLIRYEGGISDRAQLATIYREARGLVLLSTKETRSLSAEEAAACECPLLLSDLPWARSVFAEAARYCPVTASTRETARSLRQFYEEAPRIPPPPKPKSWMEVAKQFREIYQKVLNETSPSR